MVGSIHNSTSSALVFQFYHILSNIPYFPVVILANLLGVRWNLRVVLICISLIMRVLSILELFHHGM